MNTIEHTAESVSERLRLCMPQLARQLSNPNATLADLTLDSMDTVLFLCSVHEEFGVRLTESQFQPHQTIGGLLTHIGQQANSI